MCPTSPDGPAAEMGNTSAVAYRGWIYMKAQDICLQLHQGSSLGSPTRCLWYNLHSVWVAVVSG